MRNGKGLVSVHASNNAFEGWTEYDELIGGTWRETAGHAPYHNFTVKLVHEITLSRGACRIPSRRKTSFIMDFHFNTISIFWRPLSMTRRTA